MPESDINVVITRLGILSDDVGELKETLRQIATAVTRLALVEERQMQTNEALSRAFKQIEKLDLKLTGIEQRLGTLERLQPLQQQTNGWVMTSVWIAAGAADDGIIGPKTILAVRMADPHKLAARFNGHRLRFLTDLKTWPDFGRGWARRIADNLMGA